MPLDLLEADPVGLARNGVGGAAPQCLDAQGLSLDFIVKALQRDDPLRRSYLLPVPTMASSASGPSRAAIPTDAEQ